MTIANQTEVPILHYETTTLNTSVEQTSRIFIIPFAVADIKYNILGTTFYEEYKTLLSKTLQYNSNINPKINRILKNLPLCFQTTIHNFRTITESILNTRLNPNSSKNAHFAIKNFYNLHFATTAKNQFFPTIPHTCFPSKLRKTFTFIEVFTADKSNICSTIIQNSINMLQHFQEDTVKYQLQMNNQSTIKLIT